MKLKFIQIVTSSWRSNLTQLNINVYGLTKTGEVYKFVQSKNGWIPLSMDSAEPALGSKPRGKKAETIKSEEEPW